MRLPEGGEGEENRRLAALINKKNTGKDVVKMENNVIEESENARAGVNTAMLGNLELGRLGEAFAREMLEKEGFKVIFQNYRCKIGEIDIICEKERLLVFCEVKCRQSIVFGIPAEAVDAKKIRHIRRVASWYLAQKMRINRLYSDYEMRFDVIEAVFVGDEYELNHIENAFY